MFVKLLWPPLVRSSRQLQEKIRQTQGLEDRKSAIRLRRDARSSTTKLVKCQSAVANSGLSAL